MQNKGAIILQMCQYIIQYSHVDFTKEIHIITTDKTLHLTMRILLNINFQAHLLE